MVKNTIEYSDGTETVISYYPNGDKQEIESRVSGDVAIAEAKDRGEILEQAKQKRTRNPSVKTGVARKVATKREK